jgi:hypothetical protein
VSAGDTDAALLSAAGIKMGFLRNRATKTETTSVTSERHSLDERMHRYVLLYVNGLHNKDLSAYTYDRRDSTYPDARSELTVFDDTGKVTLYGREFNNGANRFVFWQ